MIERCRNAGLLEPEFYLTDGFVTIIRRRREQALNVATHVMKQEKKDCLAVYRKLS